MLVEEVTGLGFTKKRRKHLLCWLKKISVLSSYNSDLGLVVDMRGRMPVSHIRVAGFKFCPCS